MYIVRDIFKLRFGHYRDVKLLMDEAMKKGMFPEAKSMRMLSDFTGDSYRLILESGYETLDAFEKSLTGGMAKGDWKEWYEKFKEHAIGSHREILKQVM
ncbi:hypothetical protein FRZ67_16315 [Panacibacter ginsenosidivorans]|uniref:NIPSNAP domain-containing protein n=1 Tax=Panacibacter ginsenosidivorans TaxID=1813871 RepID=A0A5B8VBG9_9BACT|nr:hypothetical protein [Panacibacter ginsenosidivorans]QEC68794.1 hypothetical protein FRZ67_16315 [Panacibacter ginsenosidivorans]